MNIPRRQRVLDIPTGSIFGKLKVVKKEGKFPVGSTNILRTKYLCICSCGTYSSIWGSNLTSGGIKSCTKCKSVKHGMTVGGGKSREFSSWDSMIQRCTNPKSPEYGRYGAIGRKVCRRWDVSGPTISRRITKWGWDPELALTTPSQKRGRKVHGNS